MRLGTLSLIALLGTTTVAVAYEPYPFQRSDGLWGYVEDDHCWVIEPQFQHASLFHEGLAEVQLDGLWGFISITGQTVIKPKYERVGHFSEGLAGFKIEGKWGAIDAAGNVIIEPKFPSAPFFSEGLAPVPLNGKKLGYIDTKGNVAIPPQFDFAFEFQDGRAPVLILGEISGKIDRSGSLVELSDSQNGTSLDEWVKSREVAAGLKGASREGLSSVVNEEGKWGYVDTQNELVILQSFDRAHPFFNGRAEVVIKSKRYIIDRSGRILLDPTCDHTP